MSFADELNDLTATRQDQAPHLPGKNTAPPVKPYCVQTMNGGEIASDSFVDGTSPDWQAIFAHWGLDPEAWDVDPTSLKVNAWNGFLRDDTEPDGYRLVVLRQYKADLIALKPALGVRVDVMALIRSALKRRKPKAVTASAPGVFLVLVGDTQIGKADGDGSAGTVERIRTSIANTVERIKELRKQGRLPSVCYIGFMGDLVEGCDGNYSTQTFTTDLNFTQQLEVMTALVVAIITEIATYFESVTVFAVPGNHGENRRGGKIHTEARDNFDTYVVKAAAMVIDETMFADRVQFTFPDNNELTLTFDLDGVVCGFAHGHQYRAGAAIEVGVRKWWNGQREGRRPIGDAHLLFTAHFHHLKMSQFGTCAWFQTPALDGGSEWFNEVAGVGDSPTGILSLIVGEGVGPGGGGWADLAVL